MTATTTTAAPAITADVSPVPRPRACDGRLLGERGAARRAAILDAVDRHLRYTPWRQASIPAVSADAGVSPSTFYQYFPDLETAVRAIAERLRTQGRPVPGHLAAILVLLDWEQANLDSVVEAGGVVGSKGADEWITP